MGLKAAIQALKKAEKLKEKVQSTRDLLNDNEAWVCQQQLQNPKRTESQAMLSWCLEAASGFYLTLLQEICTAFDLDLPFRRKESVYGNGKTHRTVDHLSQPHKNSCYYICQHCLVHLGDIARYRNQNRQAEVFYRLNVEGRNKLSVSEYVAVFLKLHGLLHNSSDFLEAEKYVKMLAINLFALHHAGSCVDADKLTTFNEEQLSNDEKKVKHLVMDLMAGSLSAYLLPVYTLKEGDALMEYFALPAIKLTLDWIKLDPQVLLDSAFTSRLQIWPSLCKLLNGLQQTLTDFSTDKYSYLPLPEDRDLQGFVPLEKSFTDLRFSCQDWKLEPVSLNKLRGSRILDLGTWLSKQDNYHLVTRRTSPGAEESVMVFEAVGGQQVPPCDLIRELEELSVTKLPSPAPSDTSSWGSTATGTSTPDNSLIIGGILGGPHSPPLARDIIAEQTHSETVHERRAGILKPQGSLEKAREKEATDMTWNPNQNQNVHAITKRGRQNVAMQAIMRKTVMLGDQESPRNLEAKQVTFKTPSPSVSPGGNQGHEEIVKSKNSAWQQPKQQQQPPPQQQQQPPQQPLQSHPQALNMPFPYQNQSTSQHTILQQHNQIPRNQINATQSVFDSGDMSHQNGLLSNLHHHNPAITSNGSNLSSFAPQITSFQNHSTQIPFHQLPPPTGTNLGLTDNPSTNIGSGFSTSHQTFGVKLRQPPFTPWQEESPPLPPQSWWRGDRQSLTRQNSGGSNPQDDSVSTQTPGSQISLPYPGMNYMQGNILQQPVPRISMKSPTDMISAECSTKENQQGNSAIGGENSTIFSSTPSSSSFSALGLGANTYSLFSTPSWVNPAPTCGLEMDGNSCRTGLSSVMGVPGNNSLSIGQQSLWSGPGPSPLERLLEQQKQLREGPAPKGGT
ncbi:hypothetical protein C0J52_14254 [Blattella germanica]|nr:hypothetical protein C0J52_14254 [Blattella germanica]